jgi:hypothetical protein
MSQQIKLLLSITPTPANRVAERPIMNMPLAMNWDAVSTIEEDEEDGLPRGRLFFYNQKTKESSWIQPAPLELFVPTRVLKKKTLWFSGDPYDPDDKDFNIEIEYPENEDTNPWITPTEEYDDQPHDHDPDGYLSDPDIRNFLQTQTHFQSHPYRNQSMFTGDESLGTHPLAFLANESVRNRPTQTRDYIKFGLEPSELRWDNKEEIPSRRLNWRNH